jgi:hypothetical protein
MTLSRSAAARLFLVLMLAAAATGCEIIAGVFKAGVWVGAIIVILVVVLIVWIMGKARK